jgi:CheY-like chemotaxis protein
MIHGFVKQSKGHIRIYSEVGLGATVKIYLPRLIGAAELAAVPAIERRRGDDLPPARPDEVVLMVEDDAGVRDFAHSALLALGYAVRVAKNGEEGLAEVLKSQRIDILFTDVVLPGALNGRRLADEARRARPGLPVLFTTGYTRNAIVHDGRLDPDVTLLSKPYTQDVLAQSLRRMIDEASRNG